MQNWSAAPDMEKEYTVRMTDYALEQMQEIQRYITFSLAAPDTASKWRERMKREMASLSRFPKRVPLTEEEPWHSEGVHKMVIGKHLVYFLDDDILNVEPSHSFYEFIIKSIDMHTYHVIGFPSGIVFDKSDGSIERLS